MLRFFFNFFPSPTLLFPFFPPSQIQTPVPKPNRQLKQKHPSKQSQKYHLENPYWQTFDPYVKPLLSQEMDLRRLGELVDEKSPEVRVEKGEDGLWEKVKEHQSY